MPSFSLFIRPYLQQDDDFVPHLFSRVKESIKNVSKKQQLLIKYTQTHYYAFNAKYCNCGEKE